MKSSRAKVFGIFILNLYCCTVFYCRAVHVSSFLVYNATYLFDLFVIGAKPKPYLLVIFCITMAVQALNLQLLFATFYQLTNPSKTFYTGSEMCFIMACLQAGKI